jgi:surfeit locus 1 family protein
MPERPGGWRRLILPAITMLPVLGLLLGLGTWQVQRLHWKAALLAAIDAAEAAPPPPLAPDAVPPRYARVVATGRFDHAKEALLGLEVRGSVLGAHLLTPLLRDKGPAILVDRGWVPLERAQPIAHPPGLVTVTGYIRPGEIASAVAARDDVAGRRFYTFDPVAIGRALDLPATAPFALVALAPADAASQVLPIAARAIPRPGNPHLGYAITWYGLAAALLGVFVVFAARRLKEPPA